MNLHTLQSIVKRTLLSGSVVRRMWPVGALFALIPAVMLCPFKLGIVVGESMTPNLKPHQPIIIDRSYYRTRPPARGDVIVFTHQKVTYIKRVVGLPGDTVWFFRYLDSPPYVELITRKEAQRREHLLQTDPSLGKIGRIRIAKGEVYVVGDAKCVSIDSRDFGPIPETEIVGRVVSVPPDTDMKTAEVNQDIRSACALNSLRLH